MGDPRYPIGRFVFDGRAGAGTRKAQVDAIAQAPELLRRAVAGLGPAEFETPYRDGGWTVRQVVHHLPDAHMNAYARFKVALTEDSPKIRPYDEGPWAELADGRSAPVETSLALLESLHERWVLLLRSLRPEQFDRTFVHPEHGRAYSLDLALALYAWHGRHHVAHVSSIRERKGWT